MEREEALRLYEENEKLVFFILNKYYPTHAFDEDAAQEGRIGLWNACQSYDPERSAFSTYAGRAIRNAIAMSLRQETRLSKLPTGARSSVCREVERTSRWRTRYPARPTWTSWTPVPSSPG